MMNERRFLEEENIKTAGGDVPHDDERHPTWAGEVKKYGFDSRDTWSLDYTMVTLLFERVKFFKIKASPVIDLTYHVVDWQGKKFTQEEAIEELLNLCRDFFQSEDAFGADATKTRAIWELWAVLSPMMWW